VNLDAGLFAQVFPRNGSCRNSHGRLARGRTATATVVAKSVLLLVGIVGVTRAEFILDIAVVF